MDRKKRAKEQNVAIIETSVILGTLMFFGFMYLMLEMLGFVGN